MFKAFTFNAPASGSAPAEITAGIDTDQAYEITIHVIPNNIGGVYIYDSPTSSTGFFLMAAPSSTSSTTAPLENWNPDITLRLNNEKVYAVSNASVAIGANVIIRSV